MADRLLLGNLDCETHFAAHASPGREAAALPRNVLENISAAATLLRVFSIDEDRLWTPVEIAPERLSGPPELARPRLLSGPLAEVDGSEELLAWGETPAAASLRAGRGASRTFVEKAPLAGTLWSLPVATPGAAAKVNDKRFCHRLCENLGCALPASRVLESVSQLESHLRDPSTQPELAGGWVLKAPFSAAGRLRVISSGPELGELELKRARNLFEAQGSLVFEPWLKRTADFGFCSLVLEEKTILLGVHGLQTDPQGRFRGLVFNPLPEAAGLPGPAELERLETAVSTAAEAARKEGYVGPLEADCWSWRDGSGEEHFHPLGEINARISFGLVGRAIIEKLSGTGGWLSREPARLIIGPRRPRDAAAETIELLSPEAPDGCGAWLGRTSPA